MRGARPWWNKADASAAELERVEDGEIDALGEADRAALAAVWQERGASELSVSGGFAAIAAQLIEHGTAPGVLELVSRAVTDEVRHAGIAVEMAGRYRGSETVWPPARAFPVPVLAPSEGRLRATLLVVAMCCVNETLACGILDGQIAAAKSPLTRAALQAVLADEIDHARAGWAHLATLFVTKEIRAEIGAGWLPRLLQATLGNLLGVESPFSCEHLPAHGILTRAARKRIVASVLEGVMFPGFERAGIDATPAREWARGAFSRSTPGRSRSEARS